MATVSSNQAFFNSLKRYYTFYTGGFIVFVIILQQVDGNIIGPKILGDSTGLSAFWVLFALLLFCVGLNFLF